MPERPRPVCRSISRPLWGQRPLRLQLPHNRALQGTSADRYIVRDRTLTRHGSVQSLAPSIGLRLFQVVAAEHPRISVLPGRLFHENGPLLALGSPVADWMD